MPACTRCHRPIAEGAPSCPSCGATAARGHRAAGARRRIGFWVLAAVLTAAVLGGAGLVALVRWTAAERNAASLSAYPGPADADADAATTTGATTGATTPATSGAAAVPARAGAPARE